MPGILERIIFPYPTFVILRPAFFAGRRACPELVEGISAFAGLIVTTEEYMDPSPQKTPRWMTVQEWATASNLWAHTQLTGRMQVVSRNALRLRLCDF
jgi:hypothetical protein